MTPTIRLLATTVAAASALLAARAGATPPDAALRLATRTPIKHLIVVVGENVTFDALYATYQPAAGETVLNLRSQQIVAADGSPGPAYARAVQHRAANPGGHYSIALEDGAPYERLPPPSMAGVYDPHTLTAFGPLPDARFAALALNGPFQITRYAPYVDPEGLETGDPVHRFFQMWQQTGGSNRDLTHYAWVATTAGRGGDTPGITPAAVGQGGELMGFFNMASGDAPYFRELAGRYALSDNYHQALLGGTTANFLAIATGDAAVYTRDGRIAAPPARQVTDPNPAPGTANFYVHDGTAGGSYVRCDDPAQPGVAPIRAYLATLGRDPNCAPGTYYLVNNYEPPFLPDGSAVALGPELAVYPPQHVPDIGSALEARGVSWAWYAGGRDHADLVGDPLYAAAAAKVRAQAPAGAGPAALEAATVALARELIYNNSGDPLTSFPAVSQTPLRRHLQGLGALDADLAAGRLPAVSFVVPKNIDSGHPGYSTPARYEQFVRDLVTRLEADQVLFASTAVLITADEGGGYFDSGPIQVLDFFGDGPRIPFLVVSPYARRGHVDHTYQDHASVLKFIEYNWRMPALSPRSRDRLPNPRTAPGDPYRPVNAPAIGDLTSLFDFRRGAARH